MVDCLLVKESGRGPRNMTPTIGILELQGEHGSHQSHRALGALTCFV